MEQPCPTEQVLSAYHDGELAAAERAAIGQHVASCSACTQQLESLQLMSALLIGSQSDGLSQIAWRRLHDKLDEMAERGLVRWAWEVSGIAAAILLIGSVWLTQLADPTSATASVPPWVGVQTSADPALQEAPTPAAVWYLTDAKNAADVNP